MLPWIGAKSPRFTLVEHPDRLGYELVCDRLLEVMDADVWYAIEQSAVDAHDREGAPRT